MITITAKINISGGGGNINSVTTSDEKLNVAADLNSIVNAQGISVGTPFILGKSRLGSGAYYTNSLPYFVGRYLADSEGNFSQSYTITIRGSNIFSATIVFDKENGRHPNTIIVDGETLYDDDAQFEIAFTNTANTHTIVISNWNTPNEPLVITSIYASLDIDIDRENLISFNSYIMDRADVQKASYGIISNSANLTFADFDKQAIDLITQRVLHSGIKVDVFLNNTDNVVQEQICSMQTRELSYDNDNRQVQLSLKDNLEEWQEINVESINYYNDDGSERKPQTAQWFYEWLYEKTPSKYNMQKFEELDDETKAILRSTTIHYPLLESDNLWNDWDKLCQLCLLRIYQNNEGRTVCKYNNGN